MKKQLPWNSWAGRKLRGARNLTNHFFAVIWGNQEFAQKKRKK